MSNNPQRQHLDSAIIEEDDELVHHQTIDLPGKVRRRSSVRTGNSAFAITPTAIATGSRRWSQTTSAGIEENSIDNLPIVSVNAHHEPAIKEEGDSSDSETVIETDATSYKEGTDSPESLSRKPTISSLGISEHKSETSLSSPRGIAIITTCCASQFFDNQWVTSVNIALPMMASDLGIAQESMTWLVAAYTLTFGGFLLLSGALADRYGRKKVFIGGMLWMSVFTVAVGVSKSGIQAIIFRALQGIGAASSVPSAIGVITNYFVGKQRSKAMALFGASGAVGFVIGLVLSGLLSGTIGWRYLFYILAPVLVAISASGFFFFPQDHIETPKPKLDVIGSFVGTAAMILLVFALTQSELSGWKTPMIIVPLILSFVMLAVFHLIEKTVSSPVLPPYLWKQPSFAGIFAAGFTLYSAWASQIYYQTLIAQEVVGLSPLITGVSFIPMGAVGICFSLMVGPIVEKFPIKPVLIIGYICLVAAPFPAAFTPVGGSFWAYVLPTAIIGIIGTSFCHNIGTIALVASVPPQAKSLAGGLINTAFQIGSAVGLSLTSIANQSVKELQLEDTKGTPQATMKGYQAALFLCSGFAFISLTLTTIFTKNGQKADAGVIVH
ncbi:hypothetical protein E3Q23_03455 [Wallemia mellicola]|uniref:MFS general substrate transporter n=1 Tax=Wallemia mellicola TaxID=1708541 RepID=A0A4T0Q2Z6_9BASI|nr:hypothetical protein E3Q23_03455 [Wallemia mellicola]TIB97066.1 MFS general substrate transporter [Wallemia mellicola]TIC05379.1 MFS general substrate transporter [Wallemia mellicola]TIC09082.1 MFS general substrate transporter [Wallemia mellicola]TIC09388.1 MFS general substrate transporter [Wallemia mellicola]